MNDRELLELAAKAAGLRIKHDVCDDSGNFTSFICKSYEGGDIKWVSFNPLTDDGDAFRLASKLMLTVEFGNNMVTEPCEFYGDGTDPLAATRFAIVRAAAEIGKAMP